MTLRFVSMTLICMPLLVGCGGGGPKLYPVTGKVTVEGKPAVKVSVTFTPEGKNLPGSGGVTDAQGEFILFTTSGAKGAIAGKHKVTFSGGEVSAGAAVKDEDRYKSAASGNGMSPPAPESAKSPLPEKYLKGEAIEKQVEAKSGQTFSFDL